MKITWFGTASILLESEGEKLLFDPFVQLAGGSNPNSLEDFPADTDICITHGHVDHLFFLPDLLAELAGTYTTANFIYLAVIFLLIVKMFHMSIKQSQLETKIKDLAQKIALDENERGKEAQTSVKKVVSQKNE